VVGIEQAMCTEYREERKELILAIPKDRKITDIPKITQVCIAVQSLQAPVTVVSSNSSRASYPTTNVRLCILCSINCSDSFGAAHIDNLGR